MGGDDFQGVFVGELNGALAEELNKARTKIAELEGTIGELRHENRGLKVVAESAERRVTELEAEIKDRQDAEGALHDWVVELSEKLDEAAALLRERQELCSNPTDTGSCFQRNESSPCRGCRTRTFIASLENGK